MLDWLEQFGGLKVVQKVVQICNGLQTNLRLGKGPITALVEIAVVLSIGFLVSLLQANGTL